MLPLATLSGNGLASLRYHEKRSDGITGDSLLVMNTRLEKKAEN
jgi:hypothetical protein